MPWPGHRACSRCSEVTGCGEGEAALLPFSFINSCLQLEATAPKKRLQAACEGQAPHHPGGSVRVPTLAQPVVPAEARQGLPTPVRSEPHQVGCPALPCPVVRDGGAQRQGRQEHCVRKEKESLTGIFNLLSEYRVLKRRCNSQEPKYPFLLKLSMRKGCEHEGVRNPTSNQKH